MDKEKIRKTLLELGFKTDSNRDKYFFMEVGSQDCPGSLEYLDAYAQPYRDPTNPNHTIPEWQKDMARWCNKRMIFCTTDFKDFTPRKGFRCEEYMREYGLL